MNNQQISSGVRLEYPGYWALITSKLSNINLKVNGRPYGEYKFKEPFTLDIPAENGMVVLDLTFGGLYKSHREIVTRPGFMERVTIEYDRVTGAMSFVHIPAQAFPAQNQPAAYQNQHAAYQNPVANNPQPMKQYYFCHRGGQQMGPVDYNALRQAGIKADTMIWYEGMPDWLPASQLPELAGILNGGAQPYQQQAQHPQSTMRANTPSGYGQQNYSALQQQQGFGQQQQGFGQHQQGLVKPPTWMWLGILSTLLCCLPLGIVSIVYASKVSNLWNMGDVQGAQEASNNARLWGFISVSLGLVAIIVVIATGAY